MTCGVKKFGGPECFDLMCSECQEEWNAARNITPQWISVKERLPEDDQHVLAFNIWGEFVLVSYDFHSSYTDAHWWTGEYWESDLRITHWMPLPEPPK